MLAPLEFKSPMEIYPGAIFRYRPCATGAAPVAYLRADLMAVPSTQRDNASAYAIHSWMRVRTHPRFIPCWPCHIEQGTDNHNDTQFDNKYPLRCW